MSNFEVYIQRQPWSDALGIAIFEIRNGKRYMAEFVPLVFKELQEQEHIEKPTFEFPSSVATPLLKAFANAIGEHGIRTASDEKIQGTLEATRGWLEDMRNLVFKSKPPIKPSEQQS